MIKEYLQFKKIWFFTPFIQIATMVILFIFIAILGKICLIETGSLFGRTTSFYFETLFAPFYEEILFRGVIFGLLLKNYSVTKAIIFSSLLFGLWHLKNIFFVDTLELLKQLCYTGFVFGPLMAFVTYKTKTIWLAVILHYANNAWSFLMIYHAMAT